MEFVEAKCIQMLQSDYWTKKHTNIACSQLVFLIQYMNNVYQHRNMPITILKYMPTTIYLKMYLWSCECVYTVHGWFLCSWCDMNNVYPHRNMPITIFKYMSTTIYLKIYVWPCEYVYTHKIIPADVLQYMDVYTHRNVPTAIYFRVCLHILTCSCMFFLVWRQFGAKQNALFLSLHFFFRHSRTPTRKLGQSVGRFW